MCRRPYCACRNRASGRHLRRCRIIRTERILPIVKPEESRQRSLPRLAIERVGRVLERHAVQQALNVRSEEHTSELQSLMRISYAVFCLKKKNQQTKQTI